MRNPIIHLETHHSLLDNIEPNRPRPAGSEENTTTVAENIHEDRGESFRHHLQQFGLMYGTTWLIFRRIESVQNTARPTQATSVRFMGS